MAIPTELTALRQWTPVNASKIPTIKGWDDSTNWVAYQPGHGFFLAGYIGIDLDGCFSDPDFKALMAPYIERLAKTTWCEFSMSGNGLHAILKGNWTPTVGKKFSIKEGHTGAEFYAPAMDGTKMVNGRQFVLTGNTYPGAREAIGQDDALVAELYQAVTAMVPKEGTTGFIPKPKKSIGGVKLADFMAGKVDLHAPGVLDKKENEWLVWVMAMLTNKVAGMTMDESIESLMKLPQAKRDIMTSQHKAWWDNTHNIKAAKPKAQKVVDELPATDGEIKVKIVPYTYSIRHDAGIFRVSESGVNQIARWNQAKPLKVLDDLGTVKYHVQFDGITYKGTIDEIVKATKYSHGTDANYSTVMGTMLREMLDKADLKPRKVLKHAGFHKDGWHDEGFGTDEFDFDDLQAAQFKVRLSEIQPDKTQAVIAYESLRDAMSIQHRDIILAWGAIAPFLNELSFYTALKPALALGGTGGTGKTQALRVITTKTWGFPSEPLTSKNIQTASRLDSIFTCSAWPTVFDEVNDFPKDSVGQLKTMLTGGAKHYKKGAGIGGQKLSANGTYCAVIAMSYNYENPLYDDTALLERVFDLQITQKATKEQQTRFLDAYNAVPDGLIGRYVMDATKAWTRQDVKDYYDQQDDLPETVNGDARLNTIYKTIKAGAAIVKALFDIKLNLNGLAELVAGSREHGSTAILAITDEYITEQENDATIEDYKMPGWIQSKLARDGATVKFSYGNVIDISNRAKVKIDLPGFIEIMSRQYRQAKYMSTRVDGHPGKYGVINLDSLKAPNDEPAQDTVPPEPEPAPLPPAELDVINAEPDTLYYRIADVLRRIPNWKAKSRTSLDATLREHFGTASERNQLGNVITGMRKYHKIES